MMDVERRAKVISLFYSFLPLSILQSSQPRPLEYPSSLNLLLLPLHLPQRQHHLPLEGSQLIRMEEFVQEWTKTMIVLNPLGQLINSLIFSFSSYSSGSSCSSDSDCAGVQKCCSLCSSSSRFCLFPSTATACIHLKAAFERSAQRGNVKCSPSMFLVSLKLKLIFNTMHNFRW